MKLSKGINFACVREKSVRATETFHNPLYHLIYAAVIDSVLQENTTDKAGYAHWIS